MEHNLIGSGWYREHIAQIESWLQIIPFGLFYILIRTSPFLGSLHYYNKPHTSEENRKFLLLFLLLEHCEDFSDFKS